VHAGQGTLYLIAGVVAVDSAHDLALVRVGGHTSSALGLGDPSRAVVGDGIFVVSTPRG
jgi:S1-C subfamily serine protease